MDRMKRIMALTVSILVVAILASASSWEGSAMVGSYGDFPPGGFFAACNSFPRNTAVEVTNLETGRTITVIVVRGLDNPGIFMMVSAEAAEALGLRQGRISRVRAVEPRSVSSLAPSAGSRTALDADFNPRLLAAEELKRMGYDLLEVPETVARAPEAVATIPEAVPEAVEPTPAVVAPVPILPLAERPQLVQDLVRPEPAGPQPDPVPVPSPEVPRVAAEDKPDAINGGKPKPVRTVVLPELPEPEAPLVRAEIAPLVDETDTRLDTGAVLEESKPAILALDLPLPDETPIRVSPSPVPRRFEAPAALPDVLDKPRAPQLVPTMVELRLAEPEYPGPERVVTHELMTPTRHMDLALVSLAWPELEADEIPDIVLARLMEPVQMIPATSLAEGEVIFPIVGTPAAVARETPSFGAAETRIAMAAPEVEAQEQAEVLGPAVAGTLTSDVEVELAEASIVSEDPAVAQRAAPAAVATTPEVAIASPELEKELPGEVIVVLEPTDLRPPVVDAPVLAEAPVRTPAPPVAKAPDPVIKAPDPVVKTPDPVRTEPAVAPARPAMVIGSLEKGRHYIQVGAYRTEAAAAETVSILRMDYVIVLETPPGSATRIWKIFVGPMGRDESGMALLRVRSLGFKDAFLKVGG